MFTCFQEIEKYMLSRKTFGIKPGLERMHSLLHLLNNPERRFKSIHVAGTNGKGSTIQFLKGALLANEYRVGVFTSPSLSGLTGHIWCNDQEVEQHKWISIMNDIYPIIKQLDKKGNHPTSFEIITAVAFVYFSQSVDIALVETGMGGRYDTTNCIHPILSIITNVSKDHTAFLGNNIKEIAYHKAGIIKEDTPVILGDIGEDIIPVFQQEGKSQRATIYQLYNHFTYQDIQVTSHIQQFSWKYREEKHDVHILMQGKHQVKNASLAIMAITLLESQGINIDWQQILQGIRDSTLPGRFETIQENPLIIVDGAHNPAGVESFLETVQTIFPTEEKHLIFAAYKDKDIQTMLDSLGSHFHTVSLTSFKDERAASATYLYNMIHHPNKRNVSEWKDVVKQLVPGQNHLDGIYFITGSLAFIAQVRSFVLKK